MSKIKLEPCPHCGHEPIVKTFHGQPIILKDGTVKKPKEVYRVFCEHCDWWCCNGNSDNENLAIIQWNAYVADYKKYKKQMKMLDELEEAIYG